VAIIGAGFGGIGLGMTLKRAGIDSFTIFEKADGIGGVWRDNTYPGAACDVPSHLYSFSFEPNPEWTRVYSPQPEILDYLERCVEKYGMAPNLRLGTEVTRAQLDEGSGRWRIETNGGETVDADVLVSACGQLSRPAFSRIEGAERFEGPIFHTARWDHEVELDGKHVAVIGTGATALQCIPVIAAQATHLTVYQRTAPYVMPKKDRPYSPWERRLFRRFPPARWARRFWQWLAFEIFVSAFNQFRPVARLGIRIHERHLDEQVSDPALREVLRPDHVLGCKRVLISGVADAFLKKHNVELVTGGVRSHERGVIAEDGTERQADVIVLSTGFESTRFLAPMEIRGREGVELNEAWREGANAYLGMTVAGFPNLFIMYGPNTNLGSGSIIFQLESQMTYILDAVRKLQSRGGRLSVRPEVQASFDREIQKRLSTSVWQTGCSNWYLDEDGRNTNNWPGFTLEYRGGPAASTSRTTRSLSSTRRACSRGPRSSRAGAWRARGRASPAPARPPFSLTASPTPSPDVVDVDQVGPLPEAGEQCRERSRLVGDLGEDPQSAPRSVSRWRAMSASTPRSMLPPERIATVFPDSAGSTRPVEGPPRRPRRRPRRPAWCAPGGA
jgi:cation diffusion facilitator CzcD-associated flavoprotein CzcO